MTNLTFPSVRSVCCISIGLFLLFISTEAVYADQKINFSTSDRLQLSGSLRGRYEIADWFSPAESEREASYYYGSSKAQLGVMYLRKYLVADLQGQYSQSYALPRDAVGAGAANRAENPGRRSPGNVFIRKGSLKFAAPLESDLFSAQAGRFLYTSAREISSGDAGLEYLKRVRISERLIAPYDFWFGRSFDGLRLDYRKAELGTFTTAALRPTEGIFHTDGMKQIHDIQFVSAVFSFDPQRLPRRSDAQLFYIFYEDERGAVLQDNRLLSAEQADSSPIEIHNFGGHFLKFYGSSPVRYDTVLWGVLQAGDWGEEDHLAWSFVIEGGARFEKLYGKPWLRGGWNYGSGDSSATDADHNTFFPMLAAARRYTQTKFYNQSNISDLFAQLLWRPVPKVSLRSDLRFLWLANDSDLQYFGAGPSRQSASVLGLAGLPSGGDRFVGTVLDCTLGSKLTSWLTVELYYGHVFGGAVIENNFEDEDLDYGYLQLTGEF